MKETEGHKLVSHNYFSGVVEETVKLLNIVEQDGFPLKDVAVIAMLLQHSAMHVVGENGKDNS